MKILSNKEYKKLLEKIEKLQNERDTLYLECREAKDLKSLLEKYSEKINILKCGGDFSITIPDNVLQYVDDILGGKVIKQEGTKCLIVDTEGNVKTGLTKQKPDKGYSYKIVRK